MESLKQPSLQGCSCWQGALCLPPLTRGRVAQVNWTANHWTALIFSTDGRIPSQSFAAVPLWPLGAPWEGARLLTPTMAFSQGHIRLVCSGEGTDNWRRHLVAKVKLCVALRYSKSVSVKLAVQYSLQASQKKDKMSMKEYIILISVYFVLNRVHYHHILNPNVIEHWYDLLVRYLFFLFSRSKADQWFYIKLICSL